MPAHAITKPIPPIIGWNTSSKYTKPFNVLDVGVNVMRLPDGTHSPRRGYQAISANIGGLGFDTYESPQNGTELICINADGNLNKLVSGSLTINYAGATIADYISYEIIVDPTKTSDISTGDFDPLSIIDLNQLVTDSIQINVYDNTGAVILSVDVGKGFNEASPYLISQLVTALSALAGVTVTTTGNTLTPAAFIPYVELVNIPHLGSAVLTWMYWIQVNHTVTATFAGEAANITNPLFENASFAPFDQDTYICTRYDFPQKYDGQTVYRAGMPMGETPTVATGVAGNPNGNFFYYITYEQIDNTGRLVEGTLSPASAQKMLTSEKGIVTIPTLLSGSGWNTNAAIVNGNQTSSTINVNPSSTIKTGDTAFFIDSFGNPQTILVLNATATTITLDSPPVSVDNLTVISNNLKINIYRQDGTTAPIQLVGTIPNNPFATPIQFTDDLANGIRDYVVDPRPHDPPPITAYNAPYGNILLYTGDPVNNDFVWFSEANNPEYVSIADNFFIVPSNNDSVSGVGIAGQSAIIFKDRSIYTVNGDLINDQFSVEPVASGSNIGCAAHQTIKQVGTLLYFLHTNGVYSMNETNIFPTDKEGVPVAISLPIDQFFRQTPLNYDQQFRFKRAVAVNYNKDNQYLLFLPCEDDPKYSSGVKYANRNSQVLCYDYQGKNWYQWTQFNAAGGFAVLQDDLYFQERRLPASGNYLSNTYKQNRRYRNIDYVDHVAPIRVTMRSSWEDASQARVRKKFIRAALLFDQVEELMQNPDFSMNFRSYLNWLTINPDTQVTVTAVTNANPFSSYAFDWTKFDGYNDPFLTVPLRKGTVVKAMQIGIQMKKINTSFKLLNWVLEIAIDFRRSILK